MTELTHDGCGEGPPAACAGRQRQDTDCHTPRPVSFTQRFGDGRFPPACPSAVAPSPTMRRSPTETRRPSPACRGKGDGPAGPPSFPSAGRWIRPVSGRTRSPPGLQAIVGSRDRRGETWGRKTLAHAGSWDNCRRAILLTHSNRPQFAARCGSRAFAAVYTLKSPTLTRSSVWPRVMCDRHRTAVHASGPRHARHFDASPEATKVFLKGVTP